MKILPNSKKTLNFSLCFVDSAVIVIETLKNVDFGNNKASEESVSYADSNHINFVKFNMTHQKLQN